MKKAFFSLFIICIVSCSNGELVGRRIAPLEDSTWEESQWISAKDAPIVEGVVTAGENEATLYESVS